MFFFFLEPTTKDHRGRWDDGTGISSKPDPGERAPRLACSEVLLELFTRPGEGVRPVEDGRDVEDGHEGVGARVSLRGQIRYTQII